MVARTPFISQDCVRQALDALVYTGRHAENPLTMLLLVDEFLSNPDLPAFANNRQYALDQLLVSTVTAQFGHLRSVVGRTLPAQDASRDEILDNIRLDAQSDSLEVVGWSWLYHHFVRVDLHIPVKTFCDLVAIDERTLRRYQQHTVKRLTDTFIKLEWEARLGQTKVRLLSEVPHPLKRPQLPGRGEQADFISKGVNELQPAHFYIVGACGIGKTTFVSAIVIDLIHAGLVDQLVWIQAPNSTEHVQHRLMECLVSPNSQINLRHYLLMYRTVVVLEDMDCLQLQPVALKLLLEYLSPAVIFLTASTHIPIPDTVEVQLTEMSETQSRWFVGSVVTKSHHAGWTELVEQEWPSIWRRVGGNPLGLQLALRHLPSDIFTADETDSRYDFHQIYHRLYEQIDAGTKKAWLAFALLPDESFSPDSLRALWPDWMTGDAIGCLFDRQVLQMADTQPIRYALAHMARTAIERLCERDESVSTAMLALIQELDSAGAAPSSARITAIEHILLSKWIQLDSAFRHKWISVYSQVGMEHGHWSVWKILLAAYIETASFDAGLYRAYAICLRHLSEWAQAEQVLKAGIQEAGKRGQFVEQAQLLLQLAVVYRYQSKYDAAIGLLTRVVEMAHRYKVEFLRQALAIEFVQVALDRASLDDVEPYLSQLPDSGPGNLLRAEICFLNGEYERADAGAEQALQYADDGMWMKGKIYTLLGRIADRKVDKAAARDYFMRAVTAFEQGNDPFLLARAKTNLGACLLETQQADDARLLLEAAQAVQKELGDQVGLAVTRHNREILDQSFFN